MSSVSCKNGGVTFDSEPLPTPEKIAAVLNTTKIKQWVLQLPDCLNANEQSATMGESLVGELPAPILPYFSIHQSFVNWYTMKLQAVKKMLV